MESFGCLMIDLAGFELTSTEQDLLEHPFICGVTLFTRNYHDKAQLSALTKSLYAIKQPFIIAVDQEGGRVQRFEEGFTALPSMRYWGERYCQNNRRALSEMNSVLRLMVQELVNVGVNCNFCPVLDVDDGVSTIIGHRSFSADPTEVVQVARDFIRLLKELRMPAIGKHFPGHGGVVADSHHELPIDSRDWSEIEKRDLRVFQELALELDAVMTAHVSYPALDDLPPTYSKRWLHQILRERLSFSGLCFSDDLSMAGALGISEPEERAGAALRAGCDVLLICNDQEAVIKTLDRLSASYSPDRENRLHIFLKKLRGPWNDGLYQ